MDSLNNLIQSYIDRRTALGVAVVVLQDGKIVYSGGFGAASIEESDRGVTPQTIFDIGSIAKNICAVLIMRLVEAGLFGLDTPVVEYLPDLHFHRNEEFGRRISLRHVLSHTTGMPMAGKDWGPSSLDSLRRSIYNQVADYTFLSEPGAFHLYSNMVYCIAGHVAEAITGRYYDDLVREYVFDPLLMARATFDPSVALMYPIALLHEPAPDGNLQVIHRMASNLSGHPSGFLFCSVMDLANLACMYLNSGKFNGIRFLTPESIDEIQTLHSSRYIDAAAHPLAHASQGYGQGFNVGEYKDHRTARHGGMSLSYDNFFELFPDDGAGVVVLSNFSNDVLLMDLLSSLYDAALEIQHEGIHYLPAPATVEVDPDRLIVYLGELLNVESTSLVRFGLVGGELVILYHSSTYPLVSTGDDRFYAQLSDTYRLLIAFLFDASGQVSHVMIGGEPYHPVEVAPPSNNDAGPWPAFEGLYKDPTNYNLDEILRMKLWDGVLFFAEEDEEVPGRAISSRCFSSDLGLIEFKDSNTHPLQTLVWGKATLYNPIDETTFHRNRVIRYLVEVPVGS